jgi:hypothetical protein
MNYKKIITCLFSLFVGSAPQSIAQDRIEIEIYNKGIPEKSYLSVKCIYEEPSPVEEDNWELPAVQSWSKDLCCLDGSIVGTELLRVDLSLSFEDPCRTMIFRTFKIKPNLRGMRFLLYPGHITIVPVYPPPPVYRDGQWVSLETDS